MQSKCSTAELSPWPSDVILIKLLLNLLHLPSDMSLHSFYFLYLEKQEVYE